MRQQPTPPPEAIERARSGACLICDDAGKVRGLCDKHRQAYRRRRAKHRTKKRRAAYEQRQIEAGRILPKQYVRKLNDPFADDGAEL